jgi:hypothetical protein
LETAGAKCHEQLLASQQLQRLSELKLVQCEKELKAHAQRALDAQRALENRRQWKPVQSTDNTMPSSGMTTVGLGMTTVGLVAY